ncbi:mitogen-activated protein kinase kinase kinase 3 [Senna tora]|uniref:Mitogen-activated protein kinase kinase kinase 3 n=1 Tax=Senna tora TaxID=362788 RepID=A0A834XC91_9FABA|nr:mitogen-activated protein kinase kinase kinase 3 [Senna tora]
MIRILSTLSEASSHSLFVLYRPIRTPIKSSSTSSRFTLPALPRLICSRGSRIHTAEASSRHPLQSSKLFIHYSSTSLRLSFSSLEFLMAEMLYGIWCIQGTCYSKLYKADCLWTEYLHGRNTVHRDIKGANILVDPNGEIKLADFGMAKHINSSASMLSFKGSSYWMAHEVVMNTNGYSLAVDIWSLGCTILEMVTSKPPWSQYEGVAAIFKIGNGKDMLEIPEHLSYDAKCFI